MSSHVKVAPEPRLLAISCRSLVAGNGSEAPALAGIVHATTMMEMQRVVEGEERGLLNMCTWVWGSCVASQLEE